MGHQEVDVLAVGAGPANLALAVGLEELAPEVAARTLVVEAHSDVAWQRGMLLPWSQSQVSFLKDLVTQRNPRSRFSFINFLHANGRLDSFINMGSFTPFRIEISAYLKWVAENLSEVRFEYGKRVQRISPAFNSGGEIGSWTAEFGDGSTVSARSLSIGAGRDPYVPEVFAGLPAERVVHSTQYLARQELLDPATVKRVVVIGGAQSAAEMLVEAHQRLPETECVMVMRSIGLNNYESSKFTNELYFPSFVDQFFEARPEARGQLLTEMHRTNYSGIAPATLESLYRQMYLERLTGTERLRMMTMTEISGSRVEDGRVVLTLTSRRTGAVTELECDLVILGTGFVKEMPALVRDLATQAGVEEIVVDRAYRMRLPGYPTASVHLQGVNEATHGIADSLLSVLAARAEEIVVDLIKDRSARPTQPAPAPAPAQAQAQADHPTAATAVSAP